MNRRTFIYRTGITAAALAASRTLKAAGPTGAKRPNLIVFLPDEQRADTIACYGTKKVYSPNLARLAEQSTVFERAYVAQPICTPSRSCMQTGVWPHTSGCTHNDMGLDPRFKCFPELLNDSAYRTAYFGKWHLGDEVFVQHGYEEWASIEDQYQASFGPDRDRNAISHYAHFLMEHGLKPEAKGGGFSRKAASNLPIELSKPAFLQQRACDFLERRQRDPFVLFVSYLEPHPPYNGPLNNEHPLESIELDRTADHTFDEQMPLRYRLRQEFQAREYGTTPEGFRAVKQKYLGLVTQIDRSIGAILKKVDDLGLADNTIVVHTSDHGDMMGAHRMFGKDVMFEQSTRVPYLVRMPGQQRSARIKQPVSHIDFVPTMIDLLGGKAPAQCAGRSRAPLIRGEAMPAESVFVEWHPNKPTASETDNVLPETKMAPMATIKTATAESTRSAFSADGWKLSLRNTDRSELYNLSSDPDERHNLFDAAAGRDAQTRLTKEIAQWQKRNSDPVVLPQL